MGASSEPRPPAANMLPLVNSSGVDIFSSFFPSLACLIPPRWPCLISVHSDYVCSSYGFPMQSVFK